MIRVEFQFPEGVNPREVADLVAALVGTVSIKPRVNMDPMLEAAFVLRQDGIELNEWPKVAADPYDTDPTAPAAT